MLEQDLKKAIAHLSTADPVLGRAIDTIGPCRIEIDPIVDPFNALARAIAFQQLSGKAASTIFGRVLDLFPDRVLTPDRILDTEDDTLRGAGLSRAKTAAIKDLAAKRQEGIVPDMETLLELPDAEIVKRLTAVRGIGRWTVEMLLIFNLGRMDIMPSTDLGVQKGFQQVYDLENLPKPKELESYSEIWQPYRSIASWYFWRVADGPDSEW